MKVTARWREWAADLSAQRLRDIKDGIQTQRQVAGSITEADELLLKLCITEIESRYGK
jgi:hypothetical protein